MKFRNEERCDVKLRCVYTVTDDKHPRRRAANHIDSSD